MRQFHCLSLRVPWRRLQWWSRHNMVKYGEYVYRYDIPFYIYIYYIYMNVYNSSQQIVTLSLAFCFWCFPTRDGEIFTEDMMKMGCWSWTWGKPAGIMGVLACSDRAQASQCIQYVVAKQRRWPFSYPMKWSLQPSETKSPTPDPTPKALHKTDTDVSIPPKKKCLQVEGHGTWNIAYPTLQVEGC